MSSWCSGDVPAPCSAGPNARQEKRRACFGDESGLLKLRLSGRQRFSFVFKVGDFKDRRGAVMVTTRRCLMSGDVLKTPLPCRGLLSHLDTLSKWRAGKPFYSFLLFPPFPTSLHPLSPVLALLRFSPCLILNPRSYPRFWLRCFFNETFSHFEP